MSNSISYGLCVRACTYLSLYIDGDCSAAHVYIFTRVAFSEEVWGLSWLMTVMITKMGEGSTSGTVIIRRNLPGLSQIDSIIKIDHNLSKNQEQRQRVSHNGWKNHLTRWIRPLLFSNIYSRPYEGGQIMMLIGENLSRLYSFFSELVDDYCNLAGIHKMWRWS